MSSGSVYSPSSPLGHLSDTTSPIYPDRPIRPLPKRRLRSRLSPEFASTIFYPTAPAVSTPLLCLPFSPSVSYTDGSLSNSGDPQFGPKKSEQREIRAAYRKNGYQFRGNEVDSDEDEGVEILRRYQEQRQGMLVPRNFANGSTRGDFTKNSKPPLSQSTVSSIESVDGYDSFENTNNKKKRKIPTSGNLGNHHSTLTAEMALMGISTTRYIGGSHADSDSGVGQYYGTGNSAIPASSTGTGISGAGRGRFGRVGIRSACGRSPLGVSMNGSNTLQAVRAALQKRDYAPSSTFGGKGDGSLVFVDLCLTNVRVETGPAPERGIISTAIANAAARPSTPTKGQENVSLLEQQTTKKSSSSKTQFTFTCDTDDGRPMVWPGQNSPLTEVPYQNSDPPIDNTAQTTQSNRGFATQGTQTSPSIATQPSQTTPQPSAANQQNQQQARKPRRLPAKQYAMAARQRRLRQDSNNFHHPPSSEDIWICEFCEYESIFGSPPEALVRQYEIKDRRERRRLAEKRRLLEKAKMKGRKGKKGNKNASKSASTASAQPQQPTQKPRYDQKSVDNGSRQHQGTQSEEFLEDDYENTPMPMPPPFTSSPTKIPQPIAKNHSQSLRSANGTSSMGVMSASKGD